MTVAWLPREAEKVRKDSPFGERTDSLLREWVSQCHFNGRLWDINHWGISIMLRRLSEKTGLPCNPHTFRRTFIPNH